MTLLMRQIKEFYGQDLEEGSFEDLANLIQELAKAAVRPAYWDELGWSKSRTVVFRKTICTDNQKITTEQEGGVPAIDEKHCLQEIIDAIAHVANALKERGA